MDYYQELIVKPGNKELQSNLQYRVELRKRCKVDRSFREAVIRACREDVLYFFNAFCVLVEPRPRRDETGRLLPGIVPFCTWEHQDPVIRTIQEHLGHRDIGCLGGDTGVVSNRGVVRIKDIREDDLIWDGEDFVRHGGVISRGVKEVIRAYGLTLTPDHLVLTNEGWRRADQGLSRAKVRMLPAYRWDKLEGKGMAAEEVYDILDCGPHKRFVVIGDEPTIVHNCEKSRGEGMSWIAVLFAVHDWLFAEPGVHSTKVGMVSRNMDFADMPNNLDSLGGKLDFELKNLPTWMVGQKNIDWKRNLDNHTWINLRNGAEITAYAATGEVGSGGRATWYICDELSKFNPGDDHKAMVSLQAVTDSRLIIGTPYGAEGSYYEIMHEPSSMVKLVLDWKQNPVRRQGLYRMINGRPVAVDPVKNPLTPEYAALTNGVQEMFIRLRKKGFSLEKGQRSPWYDGQCDRPNASPYSIAQELDRDYGGTLYKIFTDDFFDKANADVCPPQMRIQVTYGDDLRPVIARQPNGLLPGLLNLWMPLDARNRPPKHEYVVGVDVSTGLGGTYVSNSVIEIIDIVQMEQVGELATNLVEPDKFADLTVAICNWLGGAYLAWEKNGPGNAYHARMLKIRYPNIYFRTKLFEPQRKKIKEPGWWTDHKSKEVLVADFKRMVATGELKIHSDALAKECQQYIRVGKDIRCAAVARGRKEGDTDAAHGDRVIAFGVAVQAMRDRPFNMSLEDELNRIEPGSIEERDLWWKQIREGQEDDWDGRTNWDLMEGRTPGGAGFASLAWGPGMLQ